MARLELPAMRHRAPQYRAAALLLVALAPWKAAADPLPSAPPAPLTAAPTPVTPSPPAPLAMETPDYPGAVWMPASPANFQPAQRPSPERPIDMIVIHDIEGTALSAVRWFQNPQAQASSHYVVDGHTGRVYQLIKERDIAWHAGDRPTNFRSVGIEHEGFAYRPGFYTPVEYEASARLVRAIALRYAIPRDRAHIIGHAEVPDSAHPGHFGGRSGHTDPGPYWDWDYFMTLVRSDARAEGPTGPPPPVVLHPGQTASATFTLTNTGDDAWPADPAAAPDAVLRGAGPVYLGVAPGGGTGESGGALSGPDWVSPRFVGSSADGPVAPGASGRFVVPLHAPADSLGVLSQPFRLYKVPVAPHAPVPFGPTLSVPVRVVPWDIVASPLSAPPPGWARKTLPDGTQTFWRKAAAPGAGDALRLQVGLPLAGSWDVYVRRAPGAGRTARAAYRVTDAVGVQARSVDQRAGGGRWRLLGRFPFAAPVGGEGPAGPGPRPDKPIPPPPLVVGVVDILPGASAPGVVVAGDVRFVGPFPAPSAPGGQASGATPAQP